MKVRFYVSEDESDVYEFPDDMTNEELDDAAFDWLDNNVAAYYEILDDNDD